MSFTTQTFIFLFFPIAICGYYLIELLQKRTFLTSFMTRIRASDLTLIMINCAFYMWACVDDLYRLFGYMLVVYCLGCLLQRAKSRSFAIVSERNIEKSEMQRLSLALPILGISLAFVVYVLIHFKYTGMLTNTWNFFFCDTLSAKSIIAPLGISFITFSAISYLADIYLGKAQPGTLIDCALYLTFFPKSFRDRLCFGEIFRIKLEIVGSTLYRFPMESAGL